MTALQLASMLRRNPVPANVQKVFDARYYPVMWGDDRYNLYLTGIDCITTDGGTTWTDIDGNPVPQRSIAIGLMGATILFVGGPNHGDVLYPTSTN